MLGKEFHRVGRLFGFGFVGKDTIASIMFQRWSQIPTIGAVWVPCFLFVWLLVEYDFGAWWCHGGAVKVVVSFNHLVGGYLGVASGRS